MKYPEYVKKYRPKGTVVKKINDVFYVYKATSRRVPGKSYPVQVVEGMTGRIDEKGFHPVTTTKVEIGSVEIRECGFTNYLLLFEDLYLAQNPQRSKRHNRTIYRSLIVYLSNNSYLNEEKEIRILTTDELTERYGIGIPAQLKVISEITEADLKRLEPLKYICRVRLGGKMMGSTLTEAQKRLLKELEVSEDEIR